jgi:hypothetical protein
VRKYSGNCSKKSFRVGLRNFRSRYCADKPVQSVITHNSKESEVKKLSKNSIEWLAAGYCGTDIVSLSIPERLEKFGYAAVANRFARGTQYFGLCVLDTIVSAEKANVLYICCEKLIKLRQFSLLRDVGAEFKFYSRKGLYGKDFSNLVMLQHENLKNSNPDLYNLSNIIWDLIIAEVPPKETDLMIYTEKLNCKTKKLLVIAENPNVFGDKGRKLLYAVKSLMYNGKHISEASEGLINANCVDVAPKQPVVVIVPKTPVFVTLEYPYTRRSMDEKLEVFLRTMRKIMQKPQNSALIYCNSEKTKLYLEAVLRMVFPNEKIGAVKAGNAKDYFAGNVKPVSLRISVVIHNDFSEQKFTHAFCYEYPKDAVTMQKQAEFCDTFYMFLDTENVFDRINFKENILLTLANAFSTDIPRKNPALCIKDFAAIFTEVLTELYELRNFRNLTDETDITKQRKKTVILGIIERKFGFTDTAVVRGFAAEKLRELLKLFDTEEFLQSNDTAKIIGIITGCIISFGENPLILDERQKKLTVFEPPLSANSDVSKIGENIKNSYKNVVKYVRSMYKNRKTDGFKFSFEELNDNAKLSALRCLWRFCAERSDTLFDFKNFVKIYNNS